ncbi:MAG: DUF4342 domain-containing protein [Thermaceae bacterium]|nr:DUF4342 domain-containing protein [Thermaceae bacterium]
MTDNETTPQAPQEPEKKRTWVEEIGVAGNQLVDRMRDLVAEGNVRRVIIRSKDGHELLTMPMTLGVLGGGVVALAAPIWAAVGALAALVAQVKLEVVREEPLEGKTESKPADSEPKA